jgi:hypothetical protein
MVDRYFLGCGPTMAFEIALVIIGTYLALVDKWIYTAQWNPLSHLYLANFMALLGSGI